MTMSIRDRLGRLLGGRVPVLQVGALCRDPGTGGVLLITSRGTGRWIIPKGWPMPGLSLAGAALCEAWEEAGIRADTATELGRYHYHKVQPRGFAIPVEVRVFGVTVLDLGDDYPEAGQRARRWFDPAEAARRVDEPELSRLILDTASGAAGPDAHG